MVAPAEARGAWTESGSATFAYGDGMGRVRVTLARDRQGPSAALRLLVAEPPALDRIGLPREVGSWLAQRGLVIVAGGAGSGKTTTLASLVRTLGERGARVVTIEDPIELVHASPWISQRAVGDHVAGVAAGVAAAMREGADAIAVGAVAGADPAMAILEAVAGGHLVLAVVGTSAHAAPGHLVELLPAERRGLGQTIVTRGLLGTIAGVVQGGSRQFEVVARPD